MTTNPYESPRGTLTAEDAPAVKPALGLWSATGYVATMSFVGLVFGGLMALAIGAIAPGYYRSLFRGVDDPAFDPHAAGVVMGLMQGLGGGALLGLVILAIYFWYLTRLKRV